MPVLLDNYACPFGFWSFGLAAKKAGYAQWHAPGEDHNRMVLTIGKTTSDAGGRLSLGLSSSIFGPGITLFPTLQLHSRQPSLHSAIFRSGQPTRCQPPYRGRASVG